jgi:hypothetical protein
MGLAPSTLESIVPKRKEVNRMNELLLEVEELEERIAPSLSFEFSAEFEVEFEYS